MVELVLLVVAVYMVVRQLRRLGGATVAPAPAGATTHQPVAPTSQQAQLAAYADRLYQEKKWLAAEKAYLKLLKVDHKNVTAYSHLGIIYSTQKNLPDALECFEIASRLKPGANTFQNLGLVYFENHNYIKSVAAFEKAIMFEPSVPRYLGLSKSQRKLSNAEGVISALVRAVDIDPSKRLLQMLAEAYEDAKRPDEARQAYVRIHELDPSDNIAARKALSGTNTPSQA